MMFYLKTLCCWLLLTAVLAAQEATPRVESLPPLDPPVSILPEEIPLPTEKAVAEKVIEKKVVEEKIIHPWYNYKAWNGSFDLGANGSEGNSQSFNLRAGLNMKREAPWNITTLTANYVNTSANSIQTADRLFLDGRYEWLFVGSPWSLYVHETTDYDEFRAFDVRVTADAGVGYDFWKTDLSRFKGRLGPGVSREIGGPNDEWIAELVFGLIYERQISKYQKFNFTVDYFPEITDYTNYRINAQINWEVVLDEINNLSMKIGVVDRYDSTDEGKKPNDIDYKTVIVWSF
jgi:putative salt-induced outer membrane protein YdiY